MSIPIFAELRGKTLDDAEPKLICVSRTGRDGLFNREKTETVLPIGGKGLLTQRTLRNDAKGAKKTWKGKFKKADRVFSADVPSVATSDNISLRIFASSLCGLCVKLLPDYPGPFQFFVSSHSAEVLRRTELEILHGF